MTPQHPNVRHALDCKVKVNIAADLHGSTIYLARQESTIYETKRLPVP